MNHDELAALQEFARARETAGIDVLLPDDAMNFAAEDDDIQVTGVPEPLPHLREISSLASWTVSSYKPGCSVASLRHPSPSYYWQSDGPQPHTLNIHFFKLVSIAHIRIYLNFELDESYTPTRIVFLAGTGHHDLQIVQDMELRQPKGWLDVDLHNAGGPTAMDEGITAFASDGDSDDPLKSPAHDTKIEEPLTNQHRPGLGASLRCFLLQLRILENHHNGKDTHLRGLQIFARDSARGSEKRITSSNTSHSFADRTESHSKRSVAKQDNVLPGLKEPDFMNITIR